jgi:FMN phosphatase YigB (HAD superfamily)
MNVTGLAVVFNMGIPEVLHITLDKFNTKKHFEWIPASGRAGYCKPAQIIFEEALKTVVTLRREAAFARDSPYHDVQGAKATGYENSLTRERLQEQRRL